MRVIFLSIVGVSTFVMSVNAETVSVVAKFSNECSADIAKLKLPDDQVVDRENVCVRKKLLTRSNYQQCLDRFEQLKAPKQEFGAFRDSCVQETTRAAPAVASLRHGTYVRKGTPCQIASNSTIMNFDGLQFTQGRFCPAPVKNVSGSSFVVSRMCPSEDGGDMVSQSDAFTIKNQNEFVLKNTVGEFEFRYCEQAALPEIWRSAVRTSDKAPSPSRSQTNTPIDPAAVNNSKGSPVQALTVQECAAKYQAVKAAGTLNGRLWNDFRRAECNSGAAQPVRPPAQVTTEQSANVDAGRGDDIRGIKLGMRAGHLPREFNSVNVIPFPQMAAAYFMGTCAKSEDNINTCVNTYFDGSDPNKPAYAIMLSNLRLGVFNNPRVAEDFFRTKYGSPSFTSRSGEEGFGNFFGGARTYLLWHSFVDITKTGNTGIANLTFMDPDAVERFAAGFKQQGDLLIAEIGPVLVGGATYVYYATLVAVNVKGAVSVRRASEQKVNEMRAAAQRQEFERAPKPRF